ncbi:phage tail tape measure protein [Clostridium sp. HBUAS56017]|uniref:phage tail tape measure protein n=1 Tax=Clostridium sp. HBUAS56017 TaxID=2571128 RepID=UPI001178454B|nr:phage tail tape measure protein [Clostridium sp. HBUAS56017]
MSDGTIIIDTKLDSSGVDKGLKEVNSNAKRNATELDGTFKTANESLTQSFKDGSEKAKKSTEEMTNDIKSKLNSMASNAKVAIAAGFASIGATILGVGAAAIKLGDDYQKASNTLQTQTGATAEEMKTLSEAMKNVYGNNFGENMQDVAESMAQVRIYLNGTNEDIQSATENAIAFRDTFGVDITESMRSVNTLMKQFGISSGEAFNLLAQGQQQGLNFSDELYDSVNEYSVQFKKLGLDAEDMFNIFSDGAADGAFNLDKIGDAVKEFSIRAIDGSKTTVDGFTQLGLNADEMASKFAAGGDTAKQAFVQVTQAIANVNDPLKQSTIGVDLFGTMWEDLGPKVTSQLGIIGDNFNKTIDTMKEINQIKYNSFGEALTGIGRQIQTNVILPIGQDVLPFLNEMANKLKEAFSSEETKASIENLSNGIGNLIKGIATLIANFLPGLLNGLGWILKNGQSIAVIIGSIAGAFAAFKAYTIISTIINSFISLKAAVAGTTTVIKGLALAFNATPLGLFVTAIGLVVGALVALWTTNEDFRNAVIGAWDKIKEVASNVWNGVVEIFNNVVNWVKGNWQGLALLLVNPFAGGFKLLYDNCNGFRTFVNNFIQSVKQFFVNGWNAIVNFFTVSIPTWINSVIQWFEQLPANIAYQMGYILASIISWGVNTWTYLSTNVPIWINSIINWFAELPGNIWNWLVNVVTNIATWGGNVYNTAITWISNTIGSIIQWFAELPSRIWEWLVNSVTSVGQWGNDMYNTASNSISNVVNGIVEWFNELPSKMLDIGGNIVAGLKQGIADAWDGLTGWIGDLCDNLTGGFAKGWDIHSPSRVFRDFIGKNLVAGIQVGVDYEFPNLQKSVQGNVSDLTSKMKSTVDYETARTTAGVVAQNNYTIQQANPNMGTNSSNGKQLIEIHTHVDVEGKEIAYAVAPYQDILDKYYEGR